MYPLNFFIQALSCVHLVYQMYVDIAVDKIKSKLLTIIVFFFYCGIFPTDYLGEECPFFP